MPISTTFKYLGLCLTLSGALAVAGCALPATQAELLVPKTDDNTFGYTDKDAGGGLYEIEFIGPEVKTREIVRQWVANAADVARRTNDDLVLWRAAQFALQKGAPEFVVTGAKRETQYYIVGRDYETIQDAVYSNITPMNPLYYSATFFRPLATLTVSLDPAAKGDKYDAEQVAAQMEQKYAQGLASAGEPQHYFYFGPSAFIQSYKTRGEEEAARKEREEGEDAYRRFRSTGPEYYKPYHGPQ
ncbi:MAG: hypothetical protein WCF16_09100 [Alphaproteobacteria bacterium]